MEHRFPALFGHVGEREKMTKMSKNHSKDPNFKQNEPHIRRAQLKMVLRAGGRRLWVILWVGKRFGTKVPHARRARPADGGRDARCGNPQYSITMLE